MNIISEMHIFNRTTRFKVSYIYRIAVLELNYFKRKKKLKLNVLKFLGKSLWFRYILIKYLWLIKSMAVWSTCVHLPLSNVKEEDSQIQNLTKYFSCHNFSFQSFDLFLLSKLELSINSYFKKKPSFQFQSEFEFFPVYLFVSTYYFLEKEKFSKFYSRGQMNTGNMLQNN